MGNSYCNLSAYLISKAINKNKLSTKLIFLHIPSKFPVLKANNLIEKLITNLL